MENRSESPKSEKPGQKRTQKNDPQDVKERRESNRRPMTNFIEKRSRERNEITSRSRTKKKAAKGQRTRWSDKQLEREHTNHQRRGMRREMGK
jgi:hypothetical protein